MDDKKRKLADKRKRGPEPEVIKIDSDWREAMKKALQKKPPTRWPKPKRKPKKKPA